MLEPQPPRRRARRVHSCAVGIAVPHSADQRHRPEETTMKRETLTPSTLSAARGYAHVAIIPAGRQVHVSGRVAFNQAGDVVGVGDLAAQAEQVYQNLGHALAAAGASFADVFKIVTYVVDITPDKVATIRGARARLFSREPYPASTMVGVTGLVHPDLLVEVEAIAALD